MLGLFLLLFFLSLFLTKSYVNLSSFMDFLLKYCLFILLSFVLPLPLFLLACLFIFFL